MQVYYLLPYPRMRISPYKDHWPALIEQTCMYPRVCIHPSLFLGTRHDKKQHHELSFSLTHPLTMDGQVVEREMHVCSQ